MFYVDRTKNLNSLAITNKFVIQKPSLKDQILLEEQMQWPAKQLLDRI